MVTPIIKLPNNFPWIGVRIDDLEIFLNEGRFASMRGEG
jgi:hypothetical protein